MTETARNETAKREIKQTTAKYSKSRIIASEAYKKHRDLLSVILEDKKEYTREDVNKMIDEYLKKGVK